MDEDIDGLIEREIDGFLIKRCAVDPQTYAFSYSLRPFSKEKESIQTVSRPRIHFVSEPVVKRNPQGYIYISSLLDDGKIYYTLNREDPLIINTGSNDTTSYDFVDYSTLKKAIVPNSDIGGDWKKAEGYDDSSWETLDGSTGGIGYEKKSGYALCNIFL